MTITEKIITKCIVKPSSPTPNYLKLHKLSFIDQTAPEMYMPLVFLYQNDESKSYQHIEMLKQSLSKTLTIFYPLAGIIRENSFVDRNDVGVEFTEVRVDARLAEVEGENMELIQKLIPIDILSHRKNAILMVKVSLFECEGIAVGVCMSHKVCDISSFIVFMNAWAAECRGDTHLIIQPSFDLASLFPPKDSILSSFTPVREQEITTNRLIFDRDKVEKLKQQFCNYYEVRNLTTVEAVTIFIWKNFMEATKVASSAASHAVNFKKRVIPSIPDHTIGNCGIPCAAISNVTTDLLQKLRAAIGEVDDNFIKKITSHEYIRILNEFSEKMSGMEICGFTSWRFPMYDVDFGWGKPVWVCIDPFPYNNFVTLMNTSSKDGIEAWINMSQDLFRLIRTNYDKLLN